MSVESEDEPNLKASVLSEWPDRSAQVMVLAGKTTISGTKTIRLRPAVVSQTPLTTAAITAAMTTGITVNFGAGAQTLNIWGSPDRVWWANAQVICARYRLSCGVGSMEAVIDIHAFAGGRAFVEVVIENGRISASSPSAPGPQTYTNATVAVNGSIIRTQSSPSANVAKYTTAAHDQFRAWYCSTWVGGDPGIEVTHDTASLQSHPIFFKPARTSTYNFQTQSFSSAGNGHQDVISQPYGSDLYSPWWCGRQRDAGMGASAADPTISMYPEWEEQYVQSGSKYVRNAVIQNALACLSYGFNYRDSTSNEVINPESVRTRFRYSETGTQSDNFPGLSDSKYPGWEFAHQPAAGLMAFLCRPSPCFIELAQKIALWNATLYLQSIIYYQTRGIAWGCRNIGHAIFLTPDAQDTLKTGLRGALARNVTRITNGFVNSPNNPLQIIMDSWSVSVSSFKDLVTSDKGFTQSLWMHHYCAAVFHALSWAKVQRSTDQTALDALADWCVQQPIRYINEQPNGGWRYIRHFTEVGQNTGDRLDINQASTWTAQIAWIMDNDNPPSVGGSWQTCGFGNDPTAYTYTGPDWFTDPPSSYDYVDRYWMALCCAVERGISGADTAWSTVTNATNGITNLPTWLDQFATGNQYGWYPRNK
jgi:hypothetical protein